MLTFSLLGTSMRRRELLAALCGLSLQGLACKASTPPRRTVPGRLVGDFASEAHRLWKQPLKESMPPPTEWEGPYDVVIAGAGVAGLSAAWRLRSAGVDSLRVLELERQAGGTSQGGYNAVSAFPWGGHYVPAPLHGRGPVARLLREMGLEEGEDEAGHPRYAEEALVHEPQERVFVLGRWEEGLFPMGAAGAKDTQALARFMSLMQHFARQKDSQGRRAFDIPVAYASREAPWLALDTLSMGAWMRQQGFHSPLLLRYVDMACRDDYGCTLEETSAWAGIFYFAARQYEGATSPFLSWPEGNARLCRQLQKNLLPCQLLPHSLVYAAKPWLRSSDSTGATPYVAKPWPRSSDSTGATPYAAKPWPRNADSTGATPSGHAGDTGAADTGDMHSRPELWAVEALDLATRRPRGFLARQVVLALPQHIVKHILPRHWLSASQLATFQQASWVVANLTLSRAPDSALAWDNVLWAADSLGYINARHQSHAFSKGQPTVLSWYFPLTGPEDSRSHLEATDYMHWHNRLLGDLAPAHPHLAQEAEELLVRRWGHAMTKPLPGFLSSGVRQLAQNPPWENLHVAHSELSGMALFEEACFHGVRAAEAALAGLGRPMASWQ